MLLNTYKENKVEQTQQVFSEPSAAIERHGCVDSQLDLVNNSPEH